MDYQQFDGHGRLIAYNNTDHTREVCTWTGKKWAPLPLPKFTVSDEGAMGFSLNWQGEGRRYHIWLDRFGRPKDDVLHSNPLVPSNQYGRYGYTKDEHRALRRTAKKWADIVTGMLIKIEAEGLIEQARKAAAAKQEAEQAARITAIVADRIERFNRASSLLPQPLRAMMATELPTT